MFWLKNCFPLYPRDFVKTFLTRTLPLLVCIILGTALSWVSIYAFWFAVWTFHSVPAARAADAVGGFILLPARWIFEALGGDQSAIFFDPTSFSGTNGLIVGILFYCVFRAFLGRREAGKTVPQESGETRRIEAKVG
jgi:hypothetical protein